MCSCPKANINLGIAVGGGLPDLPLGPDDGKLIMPAKLLPLRSQPSELPDKPPLSTQFSSAQPWG